MSVFLDRKEYTADLFSQIEQTEIFIKNHLSLRAEIRGLKRYDYLEIPENAMREALVNAYVHRDYSNFGRNIKVAVYDDLVNIVSPGGLPNGLTQADLLQGRSEIRNRVLARVFRELGYIEHWGSGLQRIKQMCEAENLATPEFVESGDFFDVKLYRPQVQIVADELGDGVDDYGRLRTITDDIDAKFKHLNSQQKQILIFALQHGKLNRADVMQLLNVEKSKAFELLKSLVELGLLMREGQGRATTYVLEKFKGLGL